MSSQSHCAADITAKFIDVATKQHGGQRSALSHLGWQTLCGASHIRSHDFEPVLGRARRAADRVIVPMARSNAHTLIFLSSARCKLPFASPHEII